MLFNILKFFHILFVITAVGANITYAVWQARAALDPDHESFALRGVKFLDDRRDSFYRPHPALPRKRGRVRVRLVG